MQINAQLHMQHTVHETHILKIMSFISSRVCAPIAEVSNCGGVGTHVLCNGTSTTSGISSTTDSRHSWAVQETSRPAIRHHTSKLPICYKSVCLFIFQLYVCRITTAVDKKQLNQK